MEKNGSPPSVGANPRLVAVLFLLKGERAYEE